MQDVNSMIEKLLEMDIIGEDDSITFTDEAKQLIHEMAEKCSKLSMVTRNKEKAESYGKELSAEDVYADMLNKMVEAPTAMHMMMAPRMLIPIIDQKIQNGETGFRYNQ